LETSTTIIHFINNYKLNNTVQFTIDAVKANTKLFWKPPQNYNFIDIKTDSCFDFKGFKSNLRTDLSFDNIKHVKIKGDLYSAQTLDLYPTINQHYIFQDWFLSIIKMYNTTLKLIKNNVHFRKISKLKKLNEIEKKYLESIKNLEGSLKIDNKLLTKYQKKKDIDECDKLTQSICNTSVKINDLKQKLQSNTIKQQQILKNIMYYTNYQKLRTNFLKEKRNQFITESSKDKKLQIKVHIMDCAISEACKNYKSCITNFLDDNIKKFRVRYWNTNKATNFIDIEKGFINDNGVLYGVFGSLLLTYNGQPFELTNEHSIKIMHNSKENAYKLIVCKKMDKPVITKQKIVKFVGLDQGNKAAVTGYTNDSVFKIGTNLNTKIIDYLTKIDTINEDKQGKYINDSKWKKYKVDKYWRKIKNMVTETHWKTINLLIKEFDVVIIGDLSTHKVAQNKATYKMSKRVGHVLNHYKFRERLKDRCAKKGIKYVMVKEKGSTKTCGYCGHYNNWVTNENTIKCAGCKCKMDRDSNSSMIHTILAYEINKKTI
jgi:IS605 OrfB family transposase